jgi:hypothetical protein
MVNISSLTKRLSAQRIALHIGFWLIFFLANILIYGHFAHDLPDFIGYELIRLPEKILISYITVYCLLPVLLHRNRVILFGLSFMLMAGSIIFVTNLIVSLTRDFHSPYSFVVTMKYLLKCLPAIGLLASIKYWREWHKNALLHEKLKSEKVSAELDMLKTQIHPHFLFNTINNIYSLSLRESKNTHYYTRSSRAKKCRPSSTC